MESYFQNDSALIFFFIVLKFYWEIPFVLYNINFMALPSFSKYHREGVHLWRSEDSTAEWILSLHLSMGPGEAHHC